MLLPYCLALLLQCRNVLCTADAPLASSMPGWRQHLVRTVNKSTPIFAANSKISCRSDDNLATTDVATANEQESLNTTLRKTGNLFPMGRHLIEVAEGINHGFLTSSCDASRLGPFEAVAFDAMLGQVQKNLRVVIKQAKNGPVSKYGFRALFKSRKSSRKVAATFTKIMNVVKVKNSPEQGPMTPLTICVTESTAQGAEGMDVLYEGCRVNTEIRALQPQGSNIVILCPSFWQAPLEPPGWACPKRDANGTLTPNEGWLQLNQQAIFVHEMIHMYLGHLYVTRNETYRLGNAVALSEEESIRNPSNYAFFYAGRGLSQSPE